MPRLTEPTRHANRRHRWRRRTAPTRSSRQPEGPCCRPARPGPRRVGLRTLQTTSARVVARKRRTGQDDRRRRVGHRDPARRRARTPATLASSWVALPSAAVLQEPPTRSRTGGTRRPLLDPTPALHALRQPTSERTIGTRDRRVARMATPVRCGTGECARALLWRKSPWKAIDGSCHCCDWAVTTSSAFGIRQSVSRAAATNTRSGVSAGSDAPTACATRRRSRPR